MRAFAVAVLLLCLAATAHAEDALRLFVDAWPVPGEVVRDALSAELNQRVVLADVPLVAPFLRVEQSAPDSVQLRYVDATGYAIERELPAPLGVQQAVESITFAAANLVRNEAAELLDELVPALAVAQPTFRVPRVRVSPAAPTPRHSGPPAAKVPRYNGPCAERADTAVGVDLLPFVGSSSTKLGRSARRGLSLGLFGTYAEGVRGLQLSVGPAVERAGLCGVSISAVGQVVRGPVVGLELGLVNFTYGPLSGASFGAINATRGFTGANLGLLNLAFGSMQGLSLGAANVSGRRDGFMLGLLNLSYGAVRGFDVGAANLALREVHGAQLGLVNVAGTGLAGAQFGLVNATLGEARGAQLGLVNVAERSRSSIGLINVIYRGRTAAELWADENSHVMVGLVHGDARIHNIYGVGMRIGSRQTSLALALGVGVRTLERGPWQLDVDTLVHYLPKEAPRDGPWFQAGLRVPLRYRFAERFGVFAAPSYSLSFSEDARADADVPWPQTIVRKGPKPRIVGQPGLTIGASLIFL